MQNNKAGAQFLHTYTTRTQTPPKPHTYPPWQTSSLTLTQHLISQRLGEDMGLVDEGRWGGQEKKRKGVAGKGWRRQKRNRRSGGA